MRRELDKNRAVAISAVVIALPSSHYRNRNRYCTEIGRTNPINDSNGSWPSRPRKRYDFDPSRQSARRNYDRWPVLRAGGERERKIGSIGTLAGADTVNLPRANRIASTIGRPLGCRQIYPEFPCRISRAPSSDAVIRTTVLSVAGMGWSCLLYTSDAADD